ncbi:MAG: hypothetical protein CVV22_04895 [Ignavibacteriae bacterium HGW-Ignavibacteriae-1]|jgi:hypothetical protein|nr:MAG: hypothetical protein CVV22_04895 [Ignavibacteriae bacterium HGW-Ignavibacteriae-1]
MKNSIVKYVVIVITYMIISYNTSFASQAEIFSLDNGDSYVFRNSIFTVLIESDGLKFYNYTVQDSLKQWNEAFVIKDGSNPIIRVVNSTSYVNIYNHLYEIENVKLIDSLIVDFEGVIFVFTNSTGIHYAQKKNDKPFRIEYQDKVNLETYQIQIANEGGKFTLNTYSMTQKDVIGNKLILVKNDQLKNDLEFQEEEVIYYKLEYLSYFGGSKTDRLMSIAVDDEENYYICGFTESNNIPIKNESLNSKFQGGSLDGFISKFDENHKLLWSTYWGGSDRDYLYRIDIDSKGNIWVGGDTESGNIIMRGSSHKKTITGYADGLLGQLAPDGYLDYSTFLGGTSYDSFTTIEIDNEDNIWCSGRTTSMDYLVTSDAYRKELTGEYSVFISKFSNKGVLLYSSLFGGNGTNMAEGFHVDSQGNAIQSGFTNSTTFPVFNTPQVRKGNGYDIFIVKYSKFGKPLWSTLIGGSGYDQCNNLITDIEGNIYVTGYTSSNNMPVFTDSYQSSLKGNRSLFLAKLNPNGELLKSTYFGGNGNEGLDVAYAQWGGITINDSGNIVIAGTTFSKDFPLLGIPTQDKIGGNSDAFILEFDTELNPVWSTYIGGTLQEDAKDIVAKKDKLYCVGWTAGKDLQITSNAFQNLNNGIFDGFISILNKSRFSRIEVQNKIIDFGKVVIGTYKDTLNAETIKCIGNIAFEIADTKHNIPNFIDFTTLSGGGAFSLPYNTTHLMDLRFTPSFLGETIGTLEFHFDGADSPEIITLIGEGVLPDDGSNTKIEVVNKVIDFGKVEIDSFKDTINAATIRCIGDKPFTISNTVHGAPNALDFVTLNGGGSFSVPNGAEHFMDLRFTPSFIGKTSGTLEFQFEGEDSPVIITLLGEGVFSGTASILLYPESLEANVGDTIEIPIILTNTVNLPYAGITSINLELDYNSTLLAPVDMEAFYKDEFVSSITLKNLPVNVNTIALPKFIACLGNAESTPLILSNVQTVNGNAEINIRLGTFRLLDLCDEGGLRLINPSAIQIESITPNPSNDKITIVFNISEKGTTEIIITDVLGGIIEKFHLDVTEYSVSQTKTIDIRNFTNGQYFLVLKTPTYIESRIFSVIK